MKDIEKSILFDISDVISSSEPKDVELLVALAKSERASSEILAHIAKSDERVVLANLLSNRNMTEPALEKVREKLAQ